MFRTYLKASALAMFGHTLGGVAAGMNSVAQYVEHALLQVCEDINGARKEAVAASEKRDDLN